MHATLTGMADRLQRSSADSAQLLHAANELSQREARLCTRRDAVSELEAALAVPLTHRNILCSSVVSDEFFDALESAHAVCRRDAIPTRLPRVATNISGVVTVVAHTMHLQALQCFFIIRAPQRSVRGSARVSKPGRARSVHCVHLA